MGTPDRRHSLFDDILGLPAVIAAILVLYGTSIWGPAISNDSAAYLMAAQNLAQGHGLSLPRVGELVPMTAWPPLLPSALAALNLTGIELREAARFMDTFLLAANIMLCGWLIRHATNSAFAAFVGTAVLALSPTLLRAYAHIWSEPLFFFLMLTSICVLVKYVEKPSPWTALLFAVIAGVSCLARYAGVSVVATGIAACLLMTGLPRGRRLIHAAIMAAAGALPMFCWFVHNASIAGNAANRSVAFRIPDMDDVRSVLGDMSVWLLPKGVPPMVRTIVLLVAVVAFILLVRAYIRWPKTTSRTVPNVMLVFIVAYEVLVAALCTFVDPAILSEERIQLPVLVAVVVFTAAACMELAAGKPYARKAAAVALVVVVLFVWRGVGWSSYACTNGLGYTSAGWAQSATLQAVKRLPADAVVFSNGPQPIYAHTGRIAWFMPSRTNFTGLANPTWDKDVASLKQALAGGGYVVIFNELYKPSRFTPAEIEAMLGNKVEAFTLADGVIMAIR